MPVRAGRRPGLRRVRSDRLRALLSTRRPSCLPFSATGPCSQCWDPQGGLTGSCPGCVLAPTSGLGPDTLRAALGPHCPSGIRGCSSTSLSGINCASPRLTSPPRLIFLPMCLHRLCPHRQLHAANRLRRGLFPAVSASGAHTCAAPSARGWAGWGLCHPEADASACPTWSAQTHRRALGVSPGNCLSEPPGAADGAPHFGGGKGSQLELGQLSVGASLPPQLYSVLGFTLPWGEP